MAGDFMRIGDAERDEAVSLLRDHHAAGRLEMDEFNDRLAQALEAKTRSDLDRLFSDLPGDKPSGVLSNEAEQAYGFAGGQPYPVAQPMVPPHVVLLPGQPGVPQMRYVVPQPLVPVQPPAELYRPWYAQWWMMLVAVLLTGITDGKLVFLFFMMPLWLWVIYPSLAKSKQQKPVLPPAAPQGANRPLTYEGRELVLKDIRAGRKVAAIKTYRHLTGASLYDAKNAVEALERGF